MAESVTKVHASNMPFDLDFCRCLCECVCTLLYVVNGIFSMMIFVVNIQAVCTNSFSWENNCL